MKFLVIGLCVAVAFGQEQLFADWSAEHNKAYASKGEALERYTIFKSNLAWINQRNTELADMQVGLNEFADMTQEEFAAIYLHPIDTDEFKSYVANSSTPQDPDNIKINGRCTTSVVNQGQCGSCWAFSAAAAIEGLLCLSLEDNMPGYGHVAPQEFVDCTDSGCNGGWPKNAISYGQKHGVCTESSYPYHAKKGSCHICKSPIKRIKGQHSCQDSGGGITKALGGNLVSISIDAGGLDFRFYKSGSFMPGVNCNHHSVNHAVTAVSTAGENSGSYRVKNSWGSSWGSGGYFTMPAGTNCLGVNAHPSVYPY